MIFTLPGQRTIIYSIGVIKSSENPQGLTAPQDNSGARAAKKKARQVKYMAARANRREPQGIDGRQALVEDSGSTSV